MTSDRPSLAEIRRRRAALVERQDRLRSVRVLRAAQAMALAAIDVRVVDKPMPAERARAMGNVHEHARSLVYVHEKWELWQLRRELETDVFPGPPRDECGACGHRRDEHGLSGCWRPECGKACGNDTEGGYVESCASRSPDGPRCALPAGHPGACARGAERWWKDEEPCRR